jgi:acetylornithine/N-succinyldiaminopimelate aminotransferase
MRNKIFAKRWYKSIQNNYGVPAITLVKGKGIIVQDADGKTYLDFLGGIATNILGHAHPSIVTAVSKQIRVLNHVSNFYSHPNAVELAEKLVSLTKTKNAKDFF